MHLKRLSDTIKKIIMTIIVRPVHKFIAESFWREQLFFNF